MTTLPTSAPSNEAPRRSLTPVLDFARRRRAKVEGTLELLGQVTDLAMQTIRAAVKGPLETNLVIAQFEQIGVKSLSIVGLTSLFIGMVLALQTAYSLEEFGGKLFVGKVVSLSLIRELAPVMMSLMVGGRVGAGITAEIGTMKVTEQIDALRALATSPIRKLVVPKVLATTFMFPLLTIISCAIGIMGGLFIAVGNLHISANFYLRSVIETVKYNDLASGVGKTFFFGFAVGLISCFNGLRTSGGADGVGRSTTMTVVTGAITILVLDFFLTKLFLLAF